MRPGEAPASAYVLPETVIELPLAAAPFCRFQSEVLPVPACKLSVTHGLDAEVAAVTSRTAARS